MAKLLKSLPFLLLILFSCGKPVKKISNSSDNLPDQSAVEEAILTCTPSLKSQHIQLIKNFNTLQTDIAKQNASYESMKNAQEISEYKLQLNDTTKSVFKLEENCNSILGTIKILEEKKTYFKTDRLKENIVCSYNHDNQDNLILQRSTKALEDKGIAQYCNFNHFVNSINKINNKVRSKFEVQDLQDINHINLNPEQVLKQDLICQQYSELTEGINQQRDQIDNLNLRLLDLMKDLKNSKPKNRETLAQEFENKYFYLYSNNEKKHTNLYEGLKNNCNMVKSYKNFDFDKCQNLSNLKSEAEQTSKSCNFTDIENHKKILLPVYNTYRASFDNDDTKDIPKVEEPKLSQEQIEKNSCLNKFSAGYSKISNNYLKLKKDIDLIENYKLNYSTSKKINLQLDIIQTYTNSMNKNLSSYLNNCKNLKDQNLNCFDKNLIDSKQYAQYCQTEAYSAYTSKTMKNSLNSIIVSLEKSSAQLIRLRPILEKLKDEIDYAPTNKGARDQYNLNLVEFKPALLNFNEICSHPYFTKLDPKTLNVAKLEESLKTCKDYVLDQQVNDITLRDFK